MLPRLFFFQRFSGDCFIDVIIIDGRNFFFFFFFLRRKKCVHRTLIILALSATFSFHSEANLHNPF